MRAAAGRLKAVNQREHLVERAQSHGNAFARILANRDF